MLRAGFAILAGAVLAAGAGTMARAQTSPQSPATANAAAQAETTIATLPSGTALNAQLNSSVDSKKVKVGDKVEAHTTEAVKYAGKTIVPLGAKLEGHVTEATARSKGDSGSTLAIQFDKAVPKKGEEISLNVAILAIAAPQSNYSGGTPGPSSDPMAGAGAAAAGGSPMAGASHQSPMPTAPAYPSGGGAGTSGGMDGSAQLSASSRGVYGLNDLKLMKTPNAGQTTVITSSGKNVHLEGGTRLLLVAQEPTATPAPAPGN